MLTFQKSTPEEVGIPSGAVLRFLERLEKYHVPMHSVHILRCGRLAAEGYYKPYTGERLHRMFSVSKTLTALAVCKLSEEGLIGLDEPVVRYFPQYAAEPDKAHPWLGEMTVRQMLMMRSCHASTAYKNHLDRDWVESFFVTPPDHKPGTVFHYDTGSSHTLCALVENMTGMPMLDYLKDKLLREIGFSEASYMLKDPFGHSMGGSGLMALPEDLLRLGYLLLKKGNVGGKQLIDRKFAEAAVSNLTSTAMTGPVSSESQGYGYQIWTGEHGSYVCYGMGGQLVICMPDEDMVCVTTADTQGLQGGNQLIYHCLFEELVPALSRGRLPEDAENAARLERKLHSLHIEAPRDVYPLSKGGVPGDEGMPAGDDLTAGATAQKINGRLFLLQENTAGFSEMTLLLERDGGVLRYRLNGRECELAFGGNRVRPGRFPGYGMFCAAGGMWLDPNTFYIRAHLLDTSVGSVHFQLFFGEDDLTVFLRKTEETIFDEYRGHLYGKSV